VLFPTLYGLNTNWFRYVFTQLDRYFKRPCSIGQVLQMYWPLYTIYNYSPRGYVRHGYDPGRKDALTGPLSVGDTSKETDFTAIDRRKGRNNDERVIPSW
jgi:hypothetical protein